MDSQILDFLTENPRVAGSKRNKAVAKFLLEKYSYLGYSAKIDEHSFMGWELLEEPKFFFIKPERIEAITTQMIWSGSTSGKVRGKLISTGTQLTFEAYPFKKFSILDEYGKELAYVLSRPDMVWLQSLTNAMDNTPCCLIDTQSFGQIEEWQKQGKEIEVEFSIKTRYLPNSILRNVVAEKNGNSEKEIIVGAHYDSVPGAPGANDNGSGTLALIALSERFSKKSVKNTLRFISFDAEDWNKLGAYTYVEGLRQKLSENKNSLSTKTSKYLKKQTALDKIETVINIDSIGAGKTIYCIADKKYASVVKSCIKKTGKNVELREGYNSPQFDGWPFHLEGIPIIHFGVYPYNYFHTPQDTKEKVEPRLIEAVVDLVEEILKELDKY